MTAQLRAMAWNVPLIRVDTEATDAGDELTGRLASESEARLARSMRPSRPYAIDREHGVLPEPAGR